MAKKKKIEKHLWRASYGYHMYTLEANSKKEVIKKIEKCRYDPKDWRIDRSY